MTPMHRVMHASDFSSASRPAFTKAVALARAARAELIVAHAIAPVLPVAGEGYMSPGAYQQMRDAAWKNGKTQIDRLTAKARKAGVRTRSLLVEGRADDQIPRAARSKHVDLLVLGTHGRTGLAKLFLGSVALRVIAAAPCPVLTVRGA